MYRLLGRKESDYLIIEDEELHHLRVLRLKEGDTVEVNDLQGNVYEGEIIQITKKQAVLKPIRKIEIQEDKLNITLYLCMPNQLSKVDDIIEPISQLGVKRFVPVISKRSAVKLSDILKKKEKWEKIALQSIKQCKRLFPVIIENPINLTNIKSEDDFKIVFYEKERENKLKSLNLPQVSNISVVIGAEGGFEESEINFLKEKGFISLSLGDYILKMETAIIVSICQIKFKFE
ncbi:MAG: 16S rRNA (uracil(1498)-N(3))-methyltransferase [Hydrogenothermaceae bacterium]|nr:16S rRNA (uracil(1498)-N(3))-methyltransferase [Hydrogenothermaceae bacterium]